MKTMNFVALGCIALGLFLSLGGNLPSPESKQSKVTYVAPVGDLRTVAEPLKAYRDKPVAKQVAKFYSDFADILSRDASEVKTTGQFRTGHQKAQRLFAQKTDMEQGLPGVSPKIDAVFVKALGIEDKDLDRTKAIEACNAIAWGLAGVD